MTIDDMRREFEANTCRLAIIGQFNLDKELQRKPNGNYFEQRIQAAWMGWQDCWKLLHTRPVPAGLVEAVKEFIEEMEYDQSNWSIVGPALKDALVKAHAQPASYQDYTWEDVAMLVQENRMLKAAQPAAGVKQVDECPDCGAPMMEVCSGLEKEARNDDLGKCRYAEMHESAKQPVRVDAGACAKAMQKDFPVMRTGPDEKGDWRASPLEIEVFKRSAAAVLSVVKDAAKEMGVDIRYED